VDERRRAGGSAAQSGGGAGSRREVLVRPRRGGRGLRFLPALLRPPGRRARRPAVRARGLAAERHRPAGLRLEAADGTRRYRILYIEIPRKNGKTTLAAGIALLLTFADKEAGAQVYSAASDKDQAAIVFEAAVAMRNANHELRRRSIAYKKALVVPSWGASFKPLSTVAKSKHGFNVHGFVFDEFHVQPDRELYDVLHTGTGARLQPLEVIITTAGSNRHSICWELHEHALKVQQGARGRRIPRRDLRGRREGRLEATRQPGERRTRTSASR
jgi:hypothetical protein